jgi:Ca2+-binding EF-hand superfamily protein
MRAKPLIALTLVVAWTAASAAAARPADERPVSRTAQGATQSGAERFDQLDRNRDGFLSRDEANDAHELDTRFSELDVNNDGKLSRDEYRVVNGGEKEMLPGAATAASGATRP